MNKDSTRLPLLSPHQLHCLCVRSKSERDFESRVEKNVLLVFEMDIFNDSDNDERFLGFQVEDIVLREAVADSDFDVNEVSSVHTLDWSN